MTISGAAGKLSLAAAGIPVVDALPVEGTMQQLAAGSAQVVLAIVVVAEAIAIYKLFAQWRRDVATGQEKLEGLIQSNTEALTGNKASNEQLCHTIERFEQVVDRCVHNA